MKYSRKPFVTIREDAVQKVVPNGSWEAQATMDISDTPLVENDLRACTDGNMFYRRDGDVIEYYAIHNTKSSAESTISRWQKLKEEWLKD